MLITLLALILIIIGGWLMTKNSDTVVYGTMIFILGVFVMATCLTIIICRHAMATQQINKNKIQYESLLKRLEIVNSEYEDVSKSDVIKDIANWNQEVYDYNYWNNNLFTNWMHSDKVAESYKYIEY